MAEEVLLHIGEYKVIKVTTTGPASYSSGGPTVTVNSAYKIEAIIGAGNDGGYVVDIKDLQDSISANTFKLKTRLVSTTSGLTEEVADGTDLSSVNFEVLLVAT